MLVVCVSWYIRFSVFFFFQAEDGIRDLVRSRGLGDVYKRQVLGLAMDVADASVMGQHALAYVLLAFGAAGLSRRVLWFPLSQQALHVLPLFLGMQLVMMVARMFGGAEFPGVLWFLSSFTAALLWHPATYVLLIPQFRPEDKDVHRPI